MEKKTLCIRILLIVICFSITSVCFYQMNQSYDPLARYPYVTDENRDIILKYLDSDDIDYLITQQIKPDDFLDFIDQPDFNIHNTLYYSVAKETQDASNDYIVNFVNKYRANFSRDMLVNLLTHYSYVDLTTFYENESILHDEIELVSDPSAPYVLLNDKTTVYKYIPSNLVNVDGVQVRSELQSDLLSMQKDFMSVVNNGQTISFEKGYVSYEQALEAYSMRLQTDPQNASLYQDSAGQSEFQLGFSVAITGAENWIDLCVENGAYSTKDYDSVLQLLDPATLVMLDWIRENAYRYGFVLRYPEDKESESGHMYQPFILRYVGKATAKKMHEENLSMEEMTFEKNIT